VELAYETKKKGLGMLVLSRKKLEQIAIGDDIVITITETRQHSVRIGIEAPRHLKILRRELDSSAPASGAEVAATRQHRGGNVPSSR